MKLLSKILGVLVAAASCPCRHRPSQREEATIDQSLIVLRDLQAIPIPDSGHAAGPGRRDRHPAANVKVGLMFGASFGSGVMLSAQSRSQLEQPRLRQDRRGQLGSSGREARSPTSCSS